MKKVNKDMVKTILNEMPDEKKAVLRKALERNMILTSARVMSWAELEIYKQGFYLKLDGTRCKFNVWADDNDGELVFRRKPNSDKLDLIYTDSGQMAESDFDNI